MTIRKLIAFVVLCIHTQSFGQNVEITQKGKEFSEKEITVKPGQKITFINDDDVAHNVYTIVNGEKVDLGIQKIGEKGDISYEAEDVYRVRCAIHPRMKLIVNVK